VNEAPSGSRCWIGLRWGFYTALDEGLEACFVGGPVTSITCIRVTRGHSRL